MTDSDVTNSLEANYTVFNNFVILLKRNLLFPDNYNNLIVAVTLMMIATVCTVIQRLKKHKRAQRCTLFEDQPKMLQDSKAYHSLDKLSKYECISSQSSLKTDTMTQHSQFLRELHYVADKCFISKYARRCIELINYCPHLANVKFGLTGLTPFHRVCFHGNVHLVQYMLTRGANPHLVTNVGEDAICMAIYYYINKPYYMYKNGAPCLDILLKAGCTLDKNNVWYNIFLKTAVRVDNKLLVEWLLANRHVSRSISIKRGNSEPPAYKKEKIYNPRWINR